MHTHALGGMLAHWCVFFQWGGQGGLDTMTCIFPTLFPRTAARNTHTLLGAPPPCPSPTHPPPPNSVCPLVPSTTSSFFHSLQLFHQGASSPTARTMSELSFTLGLLEPETRRSEQHTHTHTDRARVHPATLREEPAKEPAKEPASSDLQENQKETEGLRWTSWSEEPPAASDSADVSKQQQ